jgi:2-dehydropantoate 2-reductase
VRIATMGSGGIGGYLGARLAQAGEDVAFIARGAHLEAMQAQGLQLESPLGNINLPKVDALEGTGGIGFVDIVIFAVKLYDTEKAAAAIVPLVGPATRVVTLQNGIDSFDMLARFVPRSQIVGGATYISAYLKQPGVIVHAGGSTRTCLGQGNHPVMEAFGQACMRAGGIGLEMVDDIDHVLWNKFVAISAFSGATSLMRSGIGRIFANAESRIFIEQLRDEGMAVAAAAGHKMPEEYPQKVMSLWQTFPPETQSSMSNDLARGKPIELAWLSGRMHSLGHELGIPTPGHTAVYRALSLHAGGTGR